MRLYLAEDPRVLLDASLADLAELQRAMPECPAYLLVPESWKAESERRYLTKFNLDGLMMAEVLSFERLATRLFQTVGGTERKYLSGLGAGLVLQRLIKEDADRFPRLAALAGRAENAAELHLVLQDFTRHGIDPAQLKEDAAKCPKPLSREKLEELAELQERYARELQQLALKDSTSRLDDLAELLHSDNTYIRRQLEPLSRARIWVTGYGDLRALTAQEARLLHALDRAAAEVTLSLVTLPQNLRVFGSSEPGRESLKLLGGERAFQSVRYFTPDHEAVADSRHPEAVALARYALGKSKEAPELSDFRLRLIQTEGDVTGARWLAGEIKRLLIQTEVRRRDIGVAVLCERDELLLQEAFRSFGLDPYIERQLPLESSALYRYLDWLARILDGDTRAETFLALLKEALRPAGVRLATVDALENLALARGLQSIDRLVATFADNPLGLPAKELAILRNFAALLNFPARATLSDFNQRLKERLSHELGPFAPLEALVRQLKEEQQTSLALLTAHSWQRLGDVLDELETLYPNDELTRGNYLDLVLSGTGRSAAPRIPVGLDRVSVAPLRQLLQKDLQYLFIFNATIDNLPPPLQPDGLLHHDERAFLKEVLDRPFPNFKEDQLKSDDYILSQSLALPKRGLAFVHCRLTDDTASPFEQRLYRRYPEHRLTVAAGDLPDQRALNPMLKDLYLRLYGADYPDAVVAAWDGDQLTALDKDPLDVVIPEILVPTEDVREALLEKGHLSATHLERLAGCRYQSFVTDLLGVKERLIEEPDPRKRGSLVHRIFEWAVPDIERVVAALPEGMDETTARAAIQRELPPDYLEAIYTRAAGERDQALWLADTVYPNEGRRLMQQMQKALWAMAYDYYRERYRPYRTEWPFPQDANALVLDAGGLRLPFKGFIDRVDRAPSGDRIVDYKTGNTALDASRLYLGLDYQLPLYLAAWHRSEPDTVIQSAALLRFDREHPKARQVGEVRDGSTPSVEWDTIPSAEVCARLAERSLETGAARMEQFLAGDLSPRPETIDRKGDISPCAYCPYRTVCRFDPQLSAKREIRREPPVSGRDPWGQLAALLSEREEA